MVVPMAPALLLTSGHALAQAPQQARSSPVEVRLGMSASATDKFSAVRFRRMVEIELGQRGFLAASTAGPLSEHVAHVWVDLTSAQLAVIEVRLGANPVARRTLNISGLRWDVASRVVALATAEMVRAQTRPQRARKNHRPKAPSVEEQQRRARAAPTIAWSAFAQPVWLPQADELLAGPGLSVGYRWAGLSQHLSGRWLASAPSPGQMRWVEVGLGGAYTFWLSSDWRLDVGATAAAAAVRLGEARSVAGTVGEHDSWSARAALDLAVSRRLSAPLWAGVSLQPGYLLRELSYQDASGDDASVRGPWLGASLFLRFDQLLARP